MSHEPDPTHHQIEQRLTYALAHMISKILKRRLPNETKKESKPQRNGGIRKEDTRKID